MKTLPRALLALALALPGIPVPAMDLAATRAAIDAQLAQPRFAAARWGVAVVSLDTGRTLYAHAADQLFLPASTAKLYTAALVLGTLDTGYRIPTRVFGSPPGRRGRVDGPLVLYGMGDPSLGSDPSTAHWADDLAGQLAGNGVRRVRGDLVADSSYFAGPSWGEGWEVSDLLGGFAAPASALSVHENQWRLSITPAAQAGRAATLAFDPSPGPRDVDARMLTGPRGVTDDVNLYRTPGSARLYAFGSIGVGVPPRSLRIAMDDPARVAADELRQALQRRAISVDGQVRVVHWPQAEALPRGATMLAEVRSPPVAALLRSGLKRSQNLYLQNLLQLAGNRARATATAQPGSVTGFLSAADWGLRALRPLLERIGISPGASLIGEGTGLSRRDLTTPDAMVRLLTFLAADRDAATVRDMLPVAGADGTLAHRMRGTPAQGNVHAKTGSMTYVSALAGYVTSAAGEHLAFAIFLNDYVPPAGKPASDDIDAIAVWLAALDQHS